MTFDEWWLKLKPAECDEMKEVFRECWETSQGSKLDAPAQAAKNLLIGINNGLHGEELLSFARRSLPSPSWVCFDCGNAAQHDKRKIFTLSTYHDGDKCDVCGEEKATTQPRDFGYPEFK